MNNFINCIIIDDEESARDVLEQLLMRFCKSVNVLAKCENLSRGVAEIKALKPDLVFLDIEMPNHAGYEIVNFFDTIDFEIIFVTAYEQYAIRAFDLAALDYLLKPINIDRLKLAIKKVSEKHGLIANEEKLMMLQDNIENKFPDKISIIDKGEHKILKINEIVAIEAQESYSKIYTISEAYIVSKNLKFYENLLQDLNNFVRTHKSWIINTQQLAKYSKSDMAITMSTGLAVKLSKYKLADFEAQLLN